MNEQPIPCQHHRTSGYVLRWIVVDVVNKTLAIQLSDQCKELARFFNNALYWGALKDEHQMGCAFIENIENLCDCNLSIALDVVKNWGGK